MAVNLRIEFMPWYSPGEPLTRCGGDDGCGLLVGDMEQHRKWHENAIGHPDALPKSGSTVKGK